MLQSCFMGIGLAMDASCVSMTNGLIEKNMKIFKIIAIALVFGIFQSLMPILGFFLGRFFSDYINKFIPLIALIVLTVLGGKMIIETLKEKKHDIKVSPAKNTEDKIETDNSPLTEANSQIDESDCKENNAVLENTENCDASEATDKDVPDIQISGEESALQISDCQDVRKIKVKEIIIQAIATSIDAFSVGVLFVAEKTSFAMISFALFGIITALMCIGATFIGRKFGSLFKDKAGIIGGIILIAVGIKIFIEYMIETI